MDTLSRIQVFHKLACAYGCALMLPSPRELLDPVHNHEQLIGKGVRWERYVSRWDGTPFEYAHVFEELPTGHRNQTTYVLNRHIEADDVKALAGRSGSRAELQVLQFVSAWSCQFYESGEDVRYTKIAESGPLYSQCKLPWVANGATAGKNAHDAANALFDRDGRIMRVQLRRGDRLREYRPGCATVESVTRNVVKAAREYQRVSSRCLNQVFISTDERDSGYLGALRAALLAAGFARVHLETDVDSQYLIPDDDYFNYLVLKSIPTRVPNVKEFAWESKLLDYRIHPTILKDDNYANYMCSVEDQSVDTTSHSLSCDRSPQPPPSSPPHIPPATPPSLPSPHPSYEYPPSPYEYPPSPYECPPPPQSHPVAPSIIPLYPVVPTQPGRHDTSFNMALFSVCVIGISFGVVGSYVLAATKGRAQALSHPRELSVSRIPLDSTDGDAASEDESESPEGVDADRKSLSER